VNSVVFNGKTYRVDDFGFLDPAEQWDEGFADGMARALGIAAGLSERHWAVTGYRSGACLLAGLPAPTS